MPLVWLVRVEILSEDLCDVLVVDGLGHDWLGAVPCILIYGILGDINFALEAGGWEVFYRPEQIHTAG
jgi:hypothetical protein